MDKERLAERKGRALDDEVKCRGVTFHPNPNVAVRLPRHTTTAARVDSNVVLLMYETSKTFPPTLCQYDVLEPIHSFLCQCDSFLCQCDSFLCQCDSFLCRDFWSSVLQWPFESSLALQWKWLVYKVPK